MPKLASLPCPRCGKPLELDSEESFLGEILQTFKCGHSFAHGLLPPAEPDSLDFLSTDGTKKARDYQKTGVQFIIDSGFACVIGDQMRLGKTPQSLLALKNAFQAGTKTRALILVRAANLWQWVRETHTWFSEMPNSVWVIQGTKSWIPPGFQVYLMSMDTFGRHSSCTNESCGHPYHEWECTRKGCNCRVWAGTSMSGDLLAFDFDVVVVDEAHSFKNTGSQRSQALTSFLKNIERAELAQTLEFSCPFCRPDADGTRVHWTETIKIKTSSLEGTSRTSETSNCPVCFAQVTQSAAAHLKVQRKCGIVMLTGTAIKNRADEYFVPLNLIAPERFPSITHFRRNWLTEDYKRVRQSRFDDFKTAIAPYVLRREKEDVYTDLPPLNRIFTVIEIEDARLKKAYNKVLDNLEGTAGPSGGFSFFKSIGELQQLRQICGLAKLNWIADYTEDFLSGTDRQKLAIGVHHHSVRDGLDRFLDKFGVLKLSGEDSPVRKDQVMRTFETSKEQVLVINMLAGGVGMDFHYCDNVLIAERQWSSADEEQFEFRFYNPDLSIKNRPTNIEYVLAKGTIDQFFYELVEEKRAIFGETLGTNWSVDQDETSFQQLMERTVGSRL